MIILISGLLVFIGIHALPWNQTLRDNAVRKFGLNGYKGLFSALAALGLILIIVGKIQAEFYHLWLPPPWGHTLALPLMFIAIMLQPAAHLPTNIKRITPHPMLWGIVIWALAHLLTNGDLASVILFASLGVYALMAIGSANKRGAKIQAQRVTLRQDLLIFMIGAAVFGGFLFLHPVLFGVAVI